MKNQEKKISTDTKVDRAANDTPFPDRNKNDRGFQTLAFPCMV